MEVDRIYNKSSTAMPEIDSETVAAVITSPPYFDMLDYGSPDQIGFGQSRDEFMRAFHRVLDECIRVLRLDGAICINVCNELELSRFHGNEFSGLHFEIEKYMFGAGLYLHGLVIWDQSAPDAADEQQKPLAPKVAQGYPPEEIVFSHNFEYVLVFKQREFLRKLQASRRVAPESSARFVKPVWNVPFKYRGRTPPPIPGRLLRRLIRMVSNESEVVLDPFSGSGATACAARETGRRYIGYEVNEESYRSSIERLSGARSTA